MSHSCESRQEPFWKGCKHVGLHDYQEGVGRLPERTGSEKKLRKNSVADITGGCGLGRQAFLLPFQDKFELLNWIYYQEALQSSAGDHFFENWPEHMYGLFRIMQEDAAFYPNTVGSQPEDFTEYLESVTSALFLEAIEKLDEQKRIPRRKKGILRWFYAHGCSGTVLEWVRGGMKLSARELTDDLYSSQRTAKRWLSALYSEKFQQGMK